MSNELGEGHNPENIAVSSYQQEVRAIENKIIGLSTESPAFQAFADIADRASLLLSYDESKQGKEQGDILSALQYAGVNETIRQRRNEPAGFKGYERAYVNFALHEKILMEHTVLQPLGHLDRTRQVVTALQAIKHDAKRPARQT